MSDADAITLWLADPAATRRLGELIGRHLRPGQTLALRGDLGAGKTGLVQGLAAGLRVDDPAAVCSPTYLLVVEHPGPVPLLHLDAYQVERLRGFLADGGLDYLADAGGVVAVEWADRIADLLPPSTTLAVNLRPHRRQGVDGRLARIDNLRRWPELAAVLRRNFPGI